MDGDLLSDAELREEVTRSYVDLQAAQARYLAAVHALDSRPGSVPGARPGTEALTYLRHALRRSAAGADVRAAHAVVEDLPMLGKALAAGEVSREHVDLAVRTLRRVPRHLLDEPGLRHRVDAWFTDASRELAPWDTDRAARQLLQRLDPDGARTFDPHAVQRRELSLAVDATGMVVIRGQLDPANGAAFKAAVDAFSAPAPASEQPGQLRTPDTRSARQRRADAAGVIGRIALRQAGRGRAEPDRPKVVIHLPAAEAEQTGPLSPAWIARLACDSLVEAVDVEGLRLGRAVRTASPAQRRFLVARDRSCVIPGCPTPAAWCDAHHVDWWSEGGATDVTNLAMVCGRHHTDIHSGTWSLTMIDGVPWATPPRWLDPRQRPIRNAYRDHYRAAEQLALELAPPPDGRPDDP